MNVNLDIYQDDQINHKSLYNMDLKEFCRLIRFNEMLFLVAQCWEQEEAGLQLSIYLDEIVWRDQNIFVLFIQRCSNQKV